MVRRVLLGLALLCLFLRSEAATSGSLRGQVLDPAGAPLAGVTLTARSPGGGVEERAAVSGPDGRFSIPALPASPDYALKASLDGYATLVIPDLAVRPGQVTTITVQLTPASGLRERVQVKARAPAVTLDETGSTTRFTSESLDALPILGRNYQDVLALSPGVTDVKGDGNPNVHGARQTDLGTLVDGINTTDPLTGKIGMQLNIEALQEIEVKTSGAGADFGRAQGGFANVLTKSGGNRLEGTVKFYWRGSALDGDGAGADDPRLHGGVGDVQLRQLRFNDYMPFLSVSGPILKDRAWYFVSVESIQRQDPVNALSQSFVTTTRERRAFVKGTWQATPNTRLALTYNDDPAQQLNQGLNSLTQTESGYTIKSGGPMTTLRATTVLGPKVVLESAASFLDQHPEILPNLGADNNGNGVAFVDRNHDGLFEASERDAGEDYDGDGVFDVLEDTLVNNGRLDAKEVKFCTDANGVTGPAASLVCAGPVTVVLVDEDGFRPPWVSNQFYHPPGDGDRHLTPPRACEGNLREDVDCDGHLDNINEDTNHNGILDPGEDIDGDGRLDLGTEDRNHNGRLDDTPRPASFYPYGELRPTPADRNYQLNLRTGATTGPYYDTRRDDRSRVTLRQDLTVFVPDFLGSHDLKTGYLMERERFQRDTLELPVTALNDPGWNTGTAIDQAEHPDIHYDCDPYKQACLDPGVGRITAILPIAPATREGATGWSLGTYVQDTYKPRPNLSIGLGVRLDREVIGSSGFTAFDPVSEGARSGRLRALGGLEAGRSDLVFGNGDGVVSLGVGGDPILSDSLGTASDLRQIPATLQMQAIRILFHPQTDVVFNSPALSHLFPGLFNGSTIDPASVRSLGLPVQEPEWFTITNTNLAPRLSVSWDPAGTGRTKLFATWGRYYDRLFLSTVTGEQGLQTVERYYIYDRYGVAPQGSQVPGQPPGLSVPDHGFGSLLSSSPPSVTQVARNLKTPHSDELTAGFEREIAPETVLSVRYIRRQYADQLQDIDVNHQVRVDPATGRLSDAFGLVGSALDILGDPTIVVRLPDGRPDLFINNFFYNQVLRVGNYNHAFYHGVELDLRRRLSRRWQMDASYTYSRAMGQAEDFQSRLGNDPSTVESEFGPLDYDQRHVVKLNGSVYLPHDWQLGVASVWASGLPFSVVSRFFSHDNADYQQFRTRYGYTVFTSTGTDFVTLGRNSERNNPTLDIDLTARRHFVVGKTTWTALFEVFNLLNSDDLWIHSVEPSRTSGFDVSTLSLLNSPTELDATRRFGRRFQVGFQLQF